MTAYGLTREDWDSIVELGNLITSADKNIDGKAKGAFTRQYNQSHVGVRGIRIAGVARSSRDNVGESSYDDDAVNADDKNEVDVTFHLVTDMQGDDEGAIDTLIKQKKKTKSKGKQDATSGAKTGRGGKKQASGRGRQ